MSETTANLPSLIERALATYSSPEVVDALGEKRAANLMSLAERAIQLEIVNNEIHISPDADTEAIPIVVLKKFQTVRMGEQFLAQTPTQRESAISIIDGWGPTRRTATSVVDFVGDALGSTEKVPFRISPNTSAYVSNAEGRILVNDANFSNVQPGFALFMGRPLLGLLDDTVIGPDVFGHELTHMWQRTQQPVYAFDSQEAIDFGLLRQELEGYHVGAMIHTAMEGGERPAVPYRIPVAEMGRLVQIAVDNIRQKNNKNAEDPFRPTQQIMRELKRTLGTSILHHTLNFDNVMANMTDQYSDHRK